jgi:KilA-N domain
MSTQNNLSVFNKNYNGRAIRIREDKYVCLTDMAVASGKRLNNWIQTDKSKSYLEALSSVTGIPVTELVEISQGGIPENQGTWGHPKVALRFAQWCSDDFAVQVDFWIDELITTGTVSIAAPEPQFQRKLAPQRDLLDYWEACQQMGIDRDPLLLSLFSQRMAEQLGGSVLPPTTQVILTVRANELGYDQKQIGSGSQLGKFVSKMIPPNGKTQHGKYPVNVYDLTPELDECINAYFR